MIGMKERESLGHGTSKDSRENLENISGGTKVRTNQRNSDKHGGVGMVSGLRQRFESVENGSSAKSSRPFAIVKASGDDIDLEREGSNRRRRKAEQSEGKDKAEQSEGKDKAEQSEGKKKAEQSDGKDKAEQSEGKDKAEQSEGKKKAVQCERDGKDKIVGRIGKGHNGGNEVREILPWTRINPSETTYDLQRFSDEDVSELCMLTEAESTMLTYQFIMLNPAYVMHNGKKNFLVLILPKIFFIQKNDLVYIKFMEYLSHKVNLPCGEMRDFFNSIHRKNTRGLDFKVHAIERVFSLTLEQLQLDKKCLPRVLSRCKQGEVKRFIFSIKELIKLARECSKIFHDEDTGIYFDCFCTACEDISRQLQSKLDRVIAVRTSALLFGGVMGALLAVLVGCSGGFTSLVVVLGELAVYGSFLGYCLAFLLLLLSFVFLFF